MFGAGDCQTCSECFAALGAFLLGSRLLYFHLALAGICFRSVLRYFLKYEYDLGKDCVYSEGLRAGRSWGAGECDMSGMKLLSMSKYPQRGEGTMQCLSCQGS